MTNKKKKVPTFLCSLIPGAGEMFLGFMKQGLSLMIICFILCALTSFFNSEIFAFLVPIVWFYSFFHVHNLNALPDDEFYALEDHFIFPMDGCFPNGTDWILKQKKLLASILIFFGIFILLDTLSSGVSRILYNYELLPDYVLEAIHYSIRALPKFLVAIGIIVLGAHLINSKKKELLPGDPSEKNTAEKTDTENSS